MARVLPIHLGRCSMWRTLSKSGANQCRSRCKVVRSLGRATHPIRCQLLSRSCPQALSGIPHPDHDHDHRTAPRRVEAPSAWLGSSPSSHHRSHQLYSHLPCCPQLPRLPDLHHHQLLLLRAELGHLNSCRIRHDRCLSCQDGSGSSSSSSNNQCNCNLNSKCNSHNRHQSRIHSRHHRSHSKRSSNNRGSSPNRLSSLLSLPSLSQALSSSGLLEVELQQSPNHHKHHHKNKHPLLQSPSLPHQMLQSQQRP
mmetsp:Transcript_66277/g.143817  ORF Transcript_66277/g.143817 Transcript_66277/m.143817 type:complete len:253 (+) Transcript_66277:3-761(+)